MWQTAILNTLEHVLPALLNMEEMKVKHWCDTHGEVGVLIFGVYSAFSNVMNAAGGVNTAAVPSLVAAAKLAPVNANTAAIPQADPPGE